MTTSTRWGVAQSVTRIARGIRLVNTAGHGGILVSPTKNVLIPEYMRASDGAYEEDCDWAIPAIIFEKEWRAWADGTTWTTGDFQMQCAWSSFKQWNPAAYEKYTGKKLDVGESIVRDDAMLKAATRDLYVVSAARGDWHDQVPKGMVGVEASRASDGSCKYFLVPSDEYRTPNTLHGSASCFVITPGRHAEVMAIG